MKRILYPVLILLFCNLTTYAQFEKGKCFASGYGSVNFDIGKEKAKSGGTTHEENKYFQFDFTPAVGCFVIDRLPVGAFFDSYYHQDKDDYGTYKTTQFIVGPFVRYYIVDLNKLHPFAEARLGLGIWREKADDGDITKNNFFSTQLGVGASYFLADHVALDLLLGYDHHNWSDKADNAGVLKSTYSEKEKWTEAGFMLKLGFSVTFGK